MSEKRPGIDIVMRWLEEQESPIVVDVGAHVGKIAHMALRANKRAVVYAIEPIMASFVLMPSDSRLIKVHGVIATSVEPVDVYLPKKTGKNRTQGATLNRAILKAKKKRGAIDHIERICRVPSYTFESFVNEMSIPSIDLLKLNCEGSEYAILSEHFPVLVRALFVSWHDDQDGGHKRICVERLREQGLRCVSSIGRGDHTWEFWRQ